MLEDILEKYSPQNTRYESQLILFERKDMIKEIKILAQALIDSEKAQKK